MLAGQSTDAENSKSPLSVSKPGDDLKSSKLGSVPTLATDQSDLKHVAADQTFQQVPAGI